MEKMLPRRPSFRNGRPHRFRAVGVSLLLAVALSGTALGQDTPVTGTVTATSGAPLRGVTVIVEGSALRTMTDASGKYSIAAPANGALVFSLLGRRVVQQPVNGRSIINVSMDPVAFLEEVVVTAYTEQRRADITGAVASVNTEAASRQTGASVLQRLDATVTGITVAASGAPGSRSTVRVRGISSFQNNDPLYVIDGTPVEDSYVNFLNPNDITSIQVLKDASAASIYGARASNGVIVIETTRRGVGGPPQVTMRVRTGVAMPVRGYDDFLFTDALDYFQVVKLSYENAGLTVPSIIYGDKNNPTIPAFIYAAPGTATATDAFGRPTAVDASRYSYPRTLIIPGSSGTNWWKSVFGSAPLGDYNLDVSGGSEQNAYRVSFNYFDQVGTAKYTDFKRGSVRVNSSFNRHKLSFGENVAVAVERHHAGPRSGDVALTDDPGNYAEETIVGKSVLMQPVIPVYDINGNFAGGRCCQLGNQFNPLHLATAAKDNLNKDNRAFGNVFAALEVAPQLSLRTNLGFTLHQWSFNGINPAFPEQAEATYTTSLIENANEATNWSWTNTLRYARALGSHNLGLLLGQEATAGTFRNIAGSIANLLNTNVDSRYIQDALGTDKNITSTGTKSALLSLFGKADYSFADRYVASFTLRRDGSSRLAPGHRWGTFPAFGLGWRITNEPFLPRNTIFSDVMLRYGWGVTGNQLIPPGRIVALYGGTRGDTYYDVGGTNTSVVGGYRQTALGNPDLKWEENRSSNVGADISLLDGRINVVVDVYRRATNNLLFAPQTPGTAGIADPPIVNIGKMRNTGVDFSIGHQAAFWNATLNLSRYKNQIVAINDNQDFFYGPITTRFGNQTINKVGHPIGAFYGYIADGYFRDAADAAAHTPPTPESPCSAYCQAGAGMGRIKFRDINGDGNIDVDDLDLGFRWRAWDLSATLFGTFGNDIFENQKEFYVFREFDTNVRKDLLENSWTPNNPNAKYPRIDRSDNYSYALSSFYVEDGSYVRLRNLQLGYNVPPRFARWMQAARVYFQAENLFTITKYPGLDPALPAANITGAAGDIRDQYLGIDRGSYPTNKVFSVGIVTNF
jgi:TonB-linked SusC/RagA family outer membrane protein